MLGSGRVRLTVLVPLFVLVGVGLGACTTGGSPVGQPPTATTATTPPTAPATTPPAPTGPGAHLLGPLGYGDLHLGMTRAQAVATGLTQGTSATGTGACGGTGDGFLVGSPSVGTTDADGRLFFSASTGQLVAIYAFAGVKTPAGVELGSTYDQMYAAYPHWQHVPEPESPTDGRGGTPVPGNPNAHYRIVVRDARVVQLSLDSNHQDCYE